MSNQKIALSDVSEAQSLEALTARLAIDVGAAPTVRHDFDWLNAGLDQQKARLLALLCESEQAVLWYLPFVAYPFKLRVALGPITLWRPPATRVESRDLRTLESPDAACTEQRVVQALSVMRSELPSNGVLFFERIPEDSPEKRAFSRLAQSSRGFRALCFGPTYMHRTANIDGGLDEYLKRLGSKTRADLRRTRRRFDQGAGANAELFVARTENDLDRLVDAVLTVARTTWQHLQENSGPRDREVLRARCREAARKATLRSYVLYADGKPIAFQIGFVSQGVYDAHEIGYDPAWRKSQPGILLHVAIVEDLGITAPDVKRFDFGITDRLHKARLSTDAAEEGFYYLFPNSARGRLLYSSLRATMLLTDGLKALRQGLRARRGASLRT